MRQLIAGNWKMNTLRAEALDLAAALRHGMADVAAEMLVCPPAITLAVVAQALEGTGIAIGGQDCHQEKAGAHTGDLSAPMLRDAGASWVILGHSERRQDHGETDELVREKVLAAVAAGLTPIVCVGETGDQRRAGTEIEAVGWQLSGSLPRGFGAAVPGVLAYEPVWAIGSGKMPTEAEIAAMHAFIREELLRQFPDAGAGVRILYGGSVKAANAAALLAIPEVGGALVGGASLVAADFLAIARAGHGF
ncbi:MAG: triose-phosphate isomerase [Acetobacteraceae bacterium]